MKRKRIYREGGSTTPKKTPEWGSYIGVGSTLLPGIVDLFTETPAEKNITKTGDNYIEEANNIANTPFGGSNATLLEQSKNLPVWQNLDIDDFGGETNWVGASLQGLVSGASAGAMTGNPWVAAGAGVINGLISGLNANNSNERKRAQADRANLAGQTAASRAIDNFNAAVASTDAINDRWRLQNMYNTNYAAFGGLLETNGANWKTGASFIDNGGTHQENPFGGVQFGIAPDGMPNLVEEGEVVIKVRNNPSQSHSFAEGGSPTYDDYVVSNREFPTLEEITNANITKTPEKYEGMSWAAIYKDIFDKSHIKEVINRQDSKDYIDVLNERVAQAHEITRLRNQQEAIMNRLKKATPEEQELLLQQAGYPNLLEEAAYAAHGGEIYIKPSKRGTFTAAAKKRGMGVQEFASKVLANKENYSPAMVKKANFSRNASHWHQGGGDVYTYNPDLTFNFFDPKNPNRITNESEAFMNWISDINNYDKQGKLYRSLRNAYGSPFNMSTPESIAQYASAFADQPIMNIFAQAYQDYLNNNQPVIQTAMQQQPVISTPQQSAVVTPQQTTPTTTTTIPTQNNNGTTIQNNRPISAYDASLINSLGTNDYDFNNIRLGNRLGQNAYNNKKQFRNIYNPTTRGYNSNYTTFINYLKDNPNVYNQYIAPLLKDTFGEDISLQDYLRWSRDNRFERIHDFNNALSYFNNNNNIETLPPDSIENIINNIDNLVSIEEPDRIEHISKANNNDINDNIINDNSNYDWVVQAINGANLVADLAGWTNVADYSNTDRIGRTILPPRYIGYTPNGRYIKPQLVDTSYLAARLNNQGLAGINAAKDLSGTSSATALANIAAQNYLGQQATGEALAQSQQANNAALQQAIQNNNAVDLANAEGRLKTDSANQGAWENYVKRYADTKTKEALSREQIDTQVAANKSANWNNFLENLEGYFENQRNRKLANTIYGWSGYQIDNNINMSYSNINKNSAMTNNLKKAGITNYSTISNGRILDRQGNELGYIDNNGNIIKKQ